MSKQKAIIIIIIIFIVSFGLLFWFYFSNNLKPKEPTVIPPTLTKVYDPFGTETINNIDNLDSNNSATTTTDIIITNNTLNQLRQITDEPVSGFSLIENATTKKTNLRYVLRSNGNIYESYTDLPEQKRLSNTTVPKVYEALWLNDGQKLILRYLNEDNETIESFSVKLNSSTSTTEGAVGNITGNYLTKNIDALASNPRGDKIFSLINNVDNSTGFISKPDGLNKTSIFESTLTEWLVSWPKEEIITLNTKPSAKIPGYLYFLNSTSGNYYKVIGDINGLTSKTNKLATEILYSDSSRNIPRLYLYNIKSGENKLLPWNTLPEKCLWSNTDEKVIYCAVPKSLATGNYPDDWYQGTQSFIDSLWMMNTETGASTLVFDFEKEESKKIDIINLELDKKDNFLYFIDKNDLSLWSLNLKS